MTVLSTARSRARRFTGKRKRVTFKDTPPLPTYLVALVLGPSGCWERSEPGKVPVRTFAAKGKASLLFCGRRIAISGAPAPEDYFGTALTSSASSIRSASPTSRPARWRTRGSHLPRVVLLMDPRRHRSRPKKRVAEVITHELAHQWFGEPRHHAVVGRPVAQRGLRHLDGLQRSSTAEAQWRVWVDFDQGRAARCSSTRCFHPPSESGDEERRSRRRRTSTPSPTRRAGAVLG